MVAPEVGARMVLANLIPNLVASLLPVVLPLLAVIDSSRLIRGERSIGRQLTCAIGESSVAGLGSGSNTGARSADPSSRPHAHAGGAKSRSLTGTG
jgi:hypothetical protein